MDNEKKAEVLTFEEALARLEKIVRSLEEGNVPLDNSLALFEEGTKLVRFCSEKIDAAEQKVKILTEKNGEMVEEDFNPQMRA
ncbi:MAG TPA: exodeoxyribonuclease VII small subunit [Bacillota bacterium]|nr:exodeoxyribonuclease VII small subunit [Bacillota bacterium]HOK68494.1 exodeoxyribonuclease VII small subunit [Bacillota bacterium]HPP85122.1 exodeoxyribonuclease VII small subunit [Bacillota bacterium]